MADYQTIFESALDAIAIFNRDGVCLEANPALYALIGAAPGTLIGRKYMDFLVNPTDSVRLPPDPTQRLSQRGEASVRRLDGAILTVEYSLVLSGESSGRIVVILRDITHRRATELALRRAHDELARQAHELAVIQELGVQLGRMRDLDAVYGTLYDGVVRDFLGADHAVLALYDGNYAAYVPTRAWLNGVSVAAEAWPAMQLDGRLSRANGLPVPVIEPAAHALAEFPADLVRDLDPVPVDVLWTPIIAAHKVIGWLGVLHRQAGGFAGVNLSSLNALASVMGVALENAQLLVQMEQEIADRRRAEEALRRGRALQRTLLDAIPAGLALLNERGEILAVNRGWRDYIPAAGVAGFRIEVGANYAAAFTTAASASDEHAHAIAAGVRAVLAGDTDCSVVEYPIQSSAGARWLEVTCTPVKMEDGLGALVMLMDVSVRKEAQATLARAQIDDHHFAQELTRMVRLGNRLALAADEDELCRMAVALGLSELGFERIVIWLLEEDGRYVNGTFGTDEAGNLRDERQIRQPIAEHAMLQQLLESPHEPYFRRELPLYNHRHEQVGVGTSGAAALWNGSRVVGSLNIDNLLTGKEYSEYQWWILELYAAMVGHLLVLKRTESQLRSNELLMSRILNLLPISVSLQDAENRVLRHNPATLTTWGIGATAGPEWETIQGVHAASGKPVAEDEWAGAAALACGEPVLNQAYDVWCPDGVQRYIVSSALPVRDESGQITGAVVVDQDLTAWKEHERELAAVAARLQLVMDAADFGMILLDQEQRVLLANRIGHAYLVSLAELQPGSILTAFAGQFMADFLPGIGLDGDGTRQPSDSYIEAEFEVTGRLYTVSASHVRAERTEVGWLLVVHDVTDERAREASIRQHERMAAVGQLSAGIAHDFNNILGAITLYTQLIQRSAQLDTATTQRLEVIREQAHNASLLVRQILDFSRQTMMERQPLDLVPLVKETVKLWERTLPENLHIRTELDELSTCRIMGDPASLQQVLTNLAVNARDAMQNGGQITVTLRHITVEAGEIAGVAPGAWVYLGLGDTGEGIDPAHLPHVFEPFFTTKGVGKGTGLGLAQVYGIIRQHEGVVMAHSEVGAGTTIAIYFPALRDEPSALNPAEAHEVLPEGSGTVLLVEDNDAAREATVAILEMLGYRVVQANDGEEGLLRYRAEADRIALVISDMVMPNMGGLALVQHIRALNPAARLLITTGYPLEVEERSWLAEGHVEWLQKPFSVRELTAKVQGLLDGRGRR